MVGARSVQTSGEARLLHLLEEVGMAQGNVDSTDKWAVFFHPLLCPVDMVDDCQLFYQPEVGYTQQTPGGSLGHEGK